MSVPVTKISLRALEPDPVSEDIIGRWYAKVFFFVELQAFEYAEAIEWIGASRYGRTAIKP